ncbi:MAG: P1 family peptidase [Bacteroidales bacterium]|jgi:D-aminopeptidase|nr:P1 family peptidase [Bacteroidales bacterium]
MKYFISLLLLLTCSVNNVTPQFMTFRDFGFSIGVLPPGQDNSITDVSGVLVGHFTLNKGKNIRTGVTAIIPHPGNIFIEKVPAAVYVANGFGKLTGSTQIQELGNLETPIILTNTLSVPVAAEALIEYSLKKNENIRSVNPVVGETNDGYLNDIRGLHIKKRHVIAAIENASSNKVMQGSIGAGTGTVCFGYKGGIGTSSRKLPENMNGYTVGVLVQTNFGGILQIAGVPVGEELNQYYLADNLRQADGSCMIIVATDAPLDSRNLLRLAKRSMLGLAHTGGISSNGSGDYVIAFSTVNKIPHRSDSMVHSIKTLRNDQMSSLFLAVIEATEEAILNSLFTAKTTTGYKDRKIEALPVVKVLKIMKKYNRAPSK